MLLLFIVLYTVKSPDSLCYTTMSAMLLDFHVLHCVKFWQLVLYHYVSYALGFPCFTLVKFWQLVLYHYVSYVLGFLDFHVLNSFKFWQLVLSPDSLCYTTMSAMFLNFHVLHCVKSWQLVLNLTTCVIPLCQLCSWISCFTLCKVLTACVKSWQLVLYHYVSYAHEVICVPERFVDTWQLFCFVINYRCFLQYQGRECILFIFHSSKADLCIKCKWLNDFFFGKSSFEFFQNSVFTVYGMWRNNSMCEMLMT